MRLKHIKDSEVLIYDSVYVIKNPGEYKNKYNNLFGNNNPLELEIGMGKGDFIIKKAVDNPNINFIGFEKYASVVYLATKKLEEIKLSNLKLICADAFNIEEIFGKEIDKIYLNFSDPWPKKRHTKRRLTSEVFLKKYDNIFKNECVIEQKTDNDDLFSYSLETLVGYGYKIIEKSYDYLDTTTTEYEIKFIKKGIKIKYLKGVK